jgi:leucyl-tRNA synthetase
MGLVAMNSTEGAPSHRYTATFAQHIEAKWQRHWSEHHTFVARNPSEAGFDQTKPKQYVLDMFPFPSGTGLHVGHPRGYIASDIYARYLRMRSYNVLHAMGFDAFGLPAEQFAVEKGQHPRLTTRQNIASIRQQLSRIGFAHDPRRSIATSDLSFYKWTQWIFLKIFNAWYDKAAGRARPISELVGEFERGERRLDASQASDGRDWTELDERARRKIIDSYRLTYLDDVPVNWCPALGTVLANEEVTVDGRSERGNHPVYKRALRQWMMRITAYADRLINDLDALDWPESVKTMQRNWIGRSDGATIKFRMERTNDVLSVFTTRPDTLFGATSIVLAPEHPLIGRITTDEQRAAVDSYAVAAQAKRERERAQHAKEVTGVFTGSYAIHPLDGCRLPIWVADYVLLSYGTGSIMGVPAHDQRDFEFAKAMYLPFRAVVMPDDKWLVTNRPDNNGEVSLSVLRQRYQSDPELFKVAFESEGLSIQSASALISLNGIPTATAKRLIVHKLEELNAGQRETQYKLRDWLFSRQRYWGEPIPILHAPDGAVVPVDESELPVALPEMEDFRPEISADPAAMPVPPLTRAPEAWRIVEKNGVQYRRELNTMPQWAGSCWYYLRYLDPDNDRTFCDPAVEKYWMTSEQSRSDPRRGGVDLYVGGVEHAVLHLLYARFWHKVLYDLGHVSTPEPFLRLFNQGYVLAMAFRDERGIYVPADEVVDRGGKPVSGNSSEPTSHFYRGKPVVAEYGKMGKSLKNGISPDDIISLYGADTLRLYEMYMGPLNASQPWDPRDIVGVFRFLSRLWRKLIDETTGAVRVVDAPANVETRRLLANTIQGVRSDIERMAFHTGIAKLIEFNNYLAKLDHVPRDIARQTVLLLAPFAPHIAEELWERLGSNESLAYEPYPVADATLLSRETVELPIAIGGKTRSTIMIAPDASEEEAERAARADQHLQSSLAGKTVVRIVYIPGRMLNFVLGK